MSIIAAGTSSGTALVSTGDTNGTLVIQTNGTTVAATFGTDQSLTLVGALSAPSIAGNAVATQAQQETGTSTTVLVTPGRQQFHQSALKVWLSLTWSAGTPTVQQSYNVTSLTDVSTGVALPNFTVPFANSNWASMLGFQAINLATYSSYDAHTRSTSSVNLRFNQNGVDTDNAAYVSFAGVGDQ